MKKCTSTLLFLSFLLVVNAQITLTAESHLMQVGDFRDYFQIVNPVNDLTKAGANQVWDFTETTDGVSAVCISPSQGFSNANIVNTCGGPLEYYSNSDSSVVFWGVVQELISQEVYQVGYRILKFPFTYTDSYTDSMAFYIYDNATYDTYYYEGTVTVEADGYGTVILPYATIENVLRIRITKNITGGSSSRTTFYWYDLHNNHFIASYKRYNVNQSRARYLDEPYLITSFNIPKEYDFNILPNPANDYFIIDNPHGEMKGHLYNVDGKYCKSINITNGRQFIDIVDLPAGIYIIKCIVDNHVFSKKVAIK